MIAIESTATGLRRLVDRIRAPGPPADELPWVELVDGRRPARPHYDLATDELEHPPGAFRIGDGKGRRLRVRHAGEGNVVEPPRRSKHKFRPRRPKGERAS